MYHPDAVEPHPDARVCRPHHARAARLAPYVRTAPRSPRGRRLDEGYGWHSLRHSYATRTRRTGRRHAHPAGVAGPSGHHDHAAVRRLLTHLRTDAGAGPAADA